MFAHAYTNQDGAKYPHQNKDKIRIMPFKFTGTQNRLEIKLGGDGLTTKKQAEVERATRDLVFRSQ